VIRFNCRVNMRAGAPHLKGRWRASLMVVFPSQ
jgi:hypothetical protein